MCILLSDAEDKTSFLPYTNGKYVLRIWGKKIPYEVWTKKKNCEEPEKKAYRNRISLVINGSGVNLNVKKATSY